MSAASKLISGNSPDGDVYPMSPLQMNLIITLFLAHADWDVSVDYGLLCFIRKIKQGRLMAAHFRLLLTATYEQLSRNKTAFTNELE